MAMRTTRWLCTFALMACGGDTTDGPGTTGDVTGSATGSTTGAATGTTNNTTATTGLTTNTPVTSYPIEVQIISFDDNPQCGPNPGFTESLELVGSNGSIDIIHSAIAEDGCVDWDVEAWVIEAGRIEVDYLITGTECALECWYTMDFNLYNVGEGFWTVEINGLEQSVDVTP